MSTLLSMTRSSPVELNGPRVARPQGSCDDDPVSFRLYCLLVCVMTHTCAVSLMAGMRQDIRRRWVTRLQGCPSVHGWMSRTSAKFSLLNGWHNSHSPSTARLSLAPQLSPLLALLVSKRLN